MTSLAIHALYLQCLYLEFYIKIIIVSTDMVLLGTHKIIEYICDKHAKSSFLICEGHGSIITHGSR